MDHFQIPIPRFVNLHPKAFPRFLAKKLNQIGIARLGDAGDFVRVDLFLLMAEHPGSAIFLEGHLQSRAAVFLHGFGFLSSLMSTTGGADMGCVGALFVASPSRPVGRRQVTQVDPWKLLQGYPLAFRTGGGPTRLSQGLEQGKRPAIITTKFVIRHGVGGYLATRRSVRPVIIFVGPSALG